MSTFPNGLFSPRAIENRTGVVYDADDTKTLFAEDLEGITDEIVAIETFLQKLPEGNLWNGKISVTVSSYNLTLALKTLAGADPSTSDPVYVMIGGVFHKISSALSVTKNAGTSWCGAGSNELATMTVDYFAYLGYNSTDGMTIGFSRIPYALQYSEFSTSTTNEKYCAISDISHASSTDPYNVIGRFSATLGVSGTYYWSVPTFTPLNLVQRPIYETRYLEWLPTYVGYASAPSDTIGYQVIGRLLFVQVYISGTSNATDFTFTIPFNSYDAISVASFGYDAGSALTTPCRMKTTNASATVNVYKDMATGAWTNSGTKRLGPMRFNVRIA
jgi:hypothetical protein